MTAETKEISEEEFQDTLNNLMLHAADAAIRRGDLLEAQECARAVLARHPASKKSRDVLVRSLSILHFETAVNISRPVGQELKARFQKELFALPISPALAIVLEVDGLNADLITALADLPETQVKTFTVRRFDGTSNLLHAMLDLSPRSLIPISVLVERLLRASQHVKLIHEGMEIAHLQQEHVQDRLKELLQVR